MSVITVTSGDTVTLDPSDNRVLCFDWDRENLASGAQVSTSIFTITAIRQSGTALTKDNESLLTAVQATAALGRTIGTDNRVSQLRLLATTATVGDEYQLANAVTTTETPAQTKEQSIRVLIQNR